MPIAIERMDQSNDLIAVTAVKNRHKKNETKTIKLTFNDIKEIFFNSDTIYYIDHIPFTMFTVYRQDSYCSLYSP